MGKIKILQLTKKFPFPLKDGEAIAVSYMAKALNSLGAELTLLSMNTSKHPFDISQLPSTFNHYKSIHLVDIDNRVKVLDAFLNLFSAKSYHIERFISPEFSEKIIDILKNNHFDIVHLETLYMAPYIEIIRKNSDAKIVMRSHNVEHEIWKRIADNTALGAKKFYLKLLSKRLENFEISSLNEYDLMLAITNRDLDFFKSLGLETQSIVAPIGLDLEDYPENNLIKSAERDFCFIGSLDWLPNIEGVQWLLKEVWPKVLEKAPDAELHIAGRNTPDWLMNLEIKGLKVHGEVPDAIDFISKHRTVLVPLLSGSGMRVKILEGMASSRLVISTALGLEGINAADEQEVLIADDAESFSDAILKAYNDKKLADRIGKSAREFIQSNFDNKKIAALVLDEYKKLCDYRL